MFRLPFAILIPLALATPPLAAQHHSRAHPSHPRAPQWKDVYHTTALTVAIDPQGTIRHKDGTYTTHLRWTYASDQPIGRGKQYRVMRELIRLDCHPIRTKPVMAYAFDAQGKSVSSFVTPVKERGSLFWATRQPGKPGTEALAGVCRSLPRS